MTARPDIKADVERRVADIGRRFEARDQERASPSPWRLPIRLYRSTKDNVGREQLEDLVRFFAKPLVVDGVGETAEELDAAKERLPMWSLTVTDGRGCKLPNVTLVTALGIDCDEPEACTDNFSSRLHPLGLAAAIHTSFRAEPRARKHRLVFSLSRPITPGEFALLRPLVGQWLGRVAGIVVDPRVKDAGRRWFVPAVRRNKPYSWRILAGRPLDPEPWLAEARARAAEEERARSWDQAQIPPRPPPAPPPPGGVGQRPSALERARLYVARTPGAVTGQGGGAATMALASKLVRGFLLTDDQALSLLLDWNATCKPPWSRKDLERKVREARQKSRLPEGFLLEAEGRRAS